MATQGTEQQARLHVENVGGISETDVSFSPGVTVLKGRNATNRTSLLRAIMGACGSSAATVRGGEDEARVELTIGGETYERTFSREGPDVVAHGDGLLAADAVELAELFAFCYEPNEARRAVERGDDLREVIMRPVDTEEINREIDRLIAERDDVDERLEELDRLEGRIPELEARRSELDEEIDELEAELAETREAIEETDDRLAERRSAESELDDRMAELESLRDERSRLRQRRRAEKRSIDSLETELEELRTEYQEVPGGDGDSLGSVEAELRSLRERKRSIESDISALQSVVQFNEEMLERSNDRLHDALRDVREGDVTDELLPSDERTAVCWSCGSEVERDRLEATVDSVRSVLEHLLSERSQLRSDIAELEERKDELESKRQEIDRLERRIESTEEELAERRDRVEELTADVSDVDEEIDAVEDRVAELQQDEYDEFLALHREANELEFRLESLRDERASVESELSSLRERVAERESLEDRREALGEEITDLRTRIERIETDAVEAFNDHVERVLEALAYDNLDRIWIDRVETDGGARTADATSRFELHVVRTTDDGTAYEDTVDHLSESEREVTGLVFALAGYLVHDVHEECPFMLLDSLEAIDSDRIAKLVEYFESFPDYLIVALLPEDAAAIDVDHEQITRV